MLHTYIWKYQPGATFLEWDIQSFRLCIFHSVSDIYWTLSILRNTRNLWSLLFAFEDVIPSLDEMRNNAISIIFFRHDNETLSLHQPTKIALFNLISIRNKTRVEWMKHLNRKSVDDDWPFPTNLWNNRLTSQEAGWQEWNDLQPKIK